MKILFLYILIFFLTANSFASGIQWFEGSLVLNDQQVLVGEISIKPAYDMVLLKRNGTVDVYPAHKIQVVRFYDQDSDVNRKFVSVRNTSTVFRSYQLYEVVLSGEISLLRKERSDVTVDKNDHDALGFLYVIYYKGELTSLKKFRSRIYSQLKHSHVAELPLYVKKNRLNPNNESNAVRIIQYYNQVTSSVRDVAMN